MARVCISGFYGWGNTGDEAILLSIIDKLSDHEIIVSTTLPYTLLADYKSRLPDRVVDVRTVYDTRLDFDYYILGGGELGWGYGLRQAVCVLASDFIKAIHFGIGYNRNSRLNVKKMYPLFYSFLSLFDFVAVRDIETVELLKDIGIKPHLTMCPALSLREEPIAEIYKDAIVVVPRFSDFGREWDEKQMSWICDVLRDIEEKIVFVPFAHSDREGRLLDMQLCLEIKERIGRGLIFPNDGFTPREVKALIASSKMVITGGRYHALLWALGANKAFRIFPLAKERYSKISALLKTYRMGNLHILEQKNDKLLQQWGVKR